MIEFAYRYEISFKECNVNVNNIKERLKLITFVLYFFLHGLPSAIVALLESLSKRRFCQHGCHSHQPEVGGAVVDGE